MTTALTASRKATSRSLYQIAFSQFRRHALARFGLVILALLYLSAIFAGFLSPYSPTEYESGSNRVSWAPPTSVHWRDAQGRFGPVVFGIKREIDEVTFRDKFTEDRSQEYPLKFFVHRPSAPYRLFGLISTNVHLFGVSEPGNVYLWGTDNLGRDQLSRVLNGGQFSLAIGLIAALISVGLGVLLGGIAGYAGGWVDVTIMRLTEVLSAIPDLFLLITLRAVFPVDANPILVFYLIIIILGFVGWGGIARTIRSQLLSVREQDYISAAVALGAGHSRIVSRHMLPNTFSFVIVAVSLIIPSYILLESGLSFLGIGIVEPYSSWGSLIRVAQDGGFESITGRPWVLIPGVFIFFAVLGWQFVGDGLRDAFDPRKRQ